MTRPDPTPLIRDRGAESSPAWAPDGARLAYAVTQDGAGSIRIVDVEAPEAGVGRADDALALPIVVSRHPGQVAWSPDGRTLLVTDLAERDPGYNGQPRRGGDTGGPTFPAPTDLGARFLDAPVLAGHDVAAAPRRGPHVAGAPPRHLRRVWAALDRPGPSGRRERRRPGGRCATVTGRAPPRPPTTRRSRTSPTR